MAHILKQPIIRHTKDPSSGELRQEELKPAGFPVTLRRAQARDVRLANKEAKGDEIAIAVKLIARLSNLSEEEADHLDMEDFESLGELVSNSSPSGPKTGETASEQ